MNKAAPSLSPLSKIVSVGAIYEHYKGNRYKVIAIALHSETLEEMVVYATLDDKGSTWVRPLTMFLEHLHIDGKKVARFHEINYL